MGGKQKDNLKTHMKNLRKYLVSDSKEAAPSHEQSSQQKVSWQGSACRHHCHCRLSTGLAVSQHLSSFSISFLVTYFCYKHNTDLLLAGLLEFYCSFHFPKILNYSSHHMHKANSFLLTTDAINSFLTKSETDNTGKFSITSLTLVINANYEKTL